MGKKITINSSEDIECLRRNDLQTNKTTIQAIGKFLSRRDGLKQGDKCFEQISGPSRNNISVITAAKRRLFKKNDIVIAVMGPAGSGKSSFIQTATGRDLGVCHSLQSRTDGIAAVRIPLTDVVDVVLLDTPGFTNIHSSEFDVISRVSDWLKKTYGGSMQLSGILYVQSIFDKCGASVLQRNLGVFQKLCGKGGVRRIVITTTMWSGIHSEAGTAREDELKRDCWAGAVKAGSNLFRFGRTRESAWQILDHVLTLEFGHRWIQAQAELAAFRVDLPDTEAGQRLADLTEEVVNTLQDIRNRMKDKFVETSDPEAMKEFLVELDGLRVKRLRVDMDIRQIDASLLGRLHDLLEGTLESSSRTAQATSSFLQERCRDLIPKISENKDQTALIRGLSGNEAQQIVDFLNKVLYEVHDLAADEWKGILSLYCKLAKVAQVYPQCYELKGVHYNESTPIAEGGFAKVYKGTYQEEQICLKVVNKANKNMLRMCIKELALWAHLSHANILPFYGVYTIGEICLVSPWMEKGNLHDYVDKHPEEPRIPWLRDVVDGLIYLHQLDIVHADLKGQNILVSDDGRALITDFGLSHIGVATTKQTTTCGGTTRWMAPELLDDILDKPTKECDVWSFGCLCYEILSRKVPFYQYGWEAQVIAALQRFELPRRRGADCDEIDEQMWSLMEDCWNYIPHKRPTLEELRDRISSLSEPRDIQSETMEGWGNAPAFRKTVTTQSKFEIDLEQVYQVLRRIQPETASFHRMDRHQQDSFES